MNRADFCPGESLHTPPEHVLRHEIALRQAFVHEDFHFEIPRRIGPSWR